MPRPLLFLSNGHGEDVIATRIAAALRDLAPSVPVHAYPLVGYGDAYRAEGLEVVGVQQAMPTGGFILKGAGNLWKDVRAGLIGLTRRQVADLKARREGLLGVVAVGDVYPLVLAGRYLRLPTVFVPTAKSEYIRGHFGFEYALMRRYALRVYARDPLTAQAMKRHGVPAEYVGNVMMDALVTRGVDFGLAPGVRAVGLLPGSRQDAYGNALDLLQVVEALGSDGLAFLLSVAPSLDVSVLVDAAATQGWRAETVEEPSGSGGGTGSLPRPGEGDSGFLRPGVHSLLRKDGLEVALVTDAFADLLRRSHIVVGLAGTANEQAAGLGKPVVAFPGRGTQFTPKFARDQKRLLGDAVSLVPRDPGVVAVEVMRILSDPTRYARMGRAGRERMGEPGGALKMARGIVQAFGLPTLREDPSRTRGG